MIPRTASRSPSPRQNCSPGYASIPECRQERYNPRSSLAKKRKRENRAQWPKGKGEETKSTYIFDNVAPQAGQRFTSLETPYDPWTNRHLEATGIDPGWQCWAVGGGGGSIAAWLAERCGQAGCVLVTDINPHFLVELATLDQPTIEIQRHDIVADPLPAQTFDLIHARHVLAYEQALQRMVIALGPGDWLVVEDFDLALLDLS